MKGTEQPFIDVYPSFKEFSFWVFERGRRDLTRGPQGIREGVANGLVSSTRKVDVRLPGKGDPNSHGARPVHLIITMIKSTRTSTLSIKKSLLSRCAVVQS